MKSNMRLPLMLSALLAYSLLGVRLIPSVSAASSGYERFQSGTIEVYAEYFPIIPVDPAHPTASEEFGLKFYVVQRNWWVTGLMHFVPNDMKMSVYYRDDTTGVSDYTTWKRWYPISVSQRGWQVSWSLSGGYGPVSVRANIAVPDIWYEESNYNKYDATGPDGKTYKHLTDHYIDYSDNWWWGDTYTEGGGGMGVPNDLAASRVGNHALIWMRFYMTWTQWTYFFPFGFLPLPGGYAQVDFIFGDDIPSDTDCWITVQYGDTSFTENRGGGGGGGCPYLSVFDGVSFVNEGLMDIHNSYGVDLVRNHQLATIPGEVQNRYLLRLHEHDQTISDIDTVRLKAIIDDGRAINLPLVSAMHSENGDVLPILLRSDDKKVAELGADHNGGTSQYIDLAFVALPPSSNFLAFVFEIEGNNMVVKT